MRERRGRAGEVSEAGEYVAWATIVGRGSRCATWASMSVDGCRVMLLVAGSVGQAHTPDRRSWRSNTGSLHFVACCKHIIRHATGPVGSKESTVRVTQEGAM